MSVRILQGDCRDVLPTLPDASVQSVVTSPPYWGLRDYGTARWEGGDAACEHRQAARTPADWSTSGLQRNKKTPALSAGTIALVNHQQEPHYCDVCGRCGARRIDQQLGLEPTPEEYVGRMVEVFRAVRRVLRDNGTLWLNMGDSYASGEIGRHDSVQANNGRDWNGTRKGTVRQQSSLATGLKPKDLVGMPWRLAFALQADGWYLRADIVWAKPNPMPESVTDRPTKAHEYIFLLSKSPRYFYDADAVREPASGRASGKVADDRCLGHDPVKHRTRAGFAAVGDVEWNARNLRSVWTIPSAPFPEAHFATFPPALASRCIQAGTRQGDTVLDPFGGSGTVGAVAEQLGRHSLLIELSSAYVRMAAARTAQLGLFAQEVATG